jgi:putative ABC transport system ATP-binding protein
MIVLDKVNLSLRSPAGEVKILHHVSCAINAGETVSITGPSGSGKTSLMMVMAGLEQVTSGTITVAGSDITRLDENALALFRGKNIGIVFQAFHLIPTMTALENVALPLEVMGVPHAEKLSLEMLAAVGMARRLDHFPAQLSGGEQQRVALARAFVVTPKILFADEPTGNLDQENSRIVMDLLFNLHRQFATTLVLITHDASIAERCGRKLHIVDGVVGE